MSEQRTYPLILQVVVTVEGEDYDWRDIEAQIMDSGSYTLLAPWDTDVVAAIASTTQYDGTVVL